MEDVAPGQDVELTFKFMPGVVYTGKVEAVIWKTDFARVKRLLAGSGQQIAEGMQVRCRGGLDFYGPTGRMQLCVREVDPVFTLGHLERRRRETLAALTASGLLERNRSHPLPDLPLRLALITSEGSAAYHDFLSSLKESGYGFEVVHQITQLVRAEGATELLTSYGPGDGGPAGFYARLGFVPTGELAGDGEIIARRVLP